ncbi:MAG: regulatory protein MerR [Pseudonocardiales bacterium]|nr:regulatory protein MerR [Pseudonocardiales bacterium]
MGSHDVIARGFALPSTSGNHGPASDHLLRPPFETLSARFMTGALIARSDLGVPIGEVSRLLGVPIPTLRSWELRHGVAATERGTGKHRRYGPLDLRVLRLMRDQVARGRSASDAAKHVARLLTQVGPGADYVSRFLAAHRDTNVDGMREQLAESLLWLGLGPCLDDVVLPAMQQVGLWWQTGECNVEQEHVATEVVRSWLRGLNDTAPAPTASGPIVLACGPADLHTVGLEAFKVLLRAKKHPCRLLGARTTPLTLTSAITANAATAVVVVSHVSTARRAAVASLAAANALGVEVFYAGNAFISPGARRTLPGHYLGDHLQDAATLLSATLTTRTATRATTPGRRQSGVA